MKRMPGFITRWLHAGLAFCISLQLLLSTFMEMPRAQALRSAPEILGFESHELIGLLSLALIIAWFAWLFVRRGEEGPVALFPWLFQAPRRALLQAVQSAWVSVRARVWPSAEASEPVARAVHGLGALCALGMAVTGFLVWLGLSSHGQPTEWSRPMLALHRALATLMWLYVPAHAAMAVLHHARGEATLRRIFTLGFARQAEGIGWHEPGEKVCTPSTTTKEMHHEDTT